MRSADRCVLAGTCLLALGLATAPRASTRPAVGKVTVVKRAAVTLGGVHLEQGDAPTIRAGDVLRTDSRGYAEFRLGKSKARQMDCSIRTVRTAGNVRFTAKSLTYVGGRVACVTRGAGSWRPKLPNAFLSFDDPLFEVDVGKAGVVVKVRRGRIVVGGLSAAAAPVVVGRNQQTTVKAGAPTAPTAAVVSPAEAQALNQLASKAPPSKDSSTPVPTVEGPLEPFPIRAPAFRFSSNEAGVIFSCSLDGGGSHVCASPTTLADLPPGGHTLTVQATDAAGNSARQTVSWLASQIVFAVSADNGAPEADLYAIDPDGSHRAQLTQMSGAEEDPDWSPDHKLIAFHHMQGGRAPEIWVMDASGGNQRLISPNGRNPAWSPDGSKLVFESTRDGNRELYVMDANGGNVVRLTKNAAEDFDPCWSPDGKRTAFASSRDGNYEIYTMNAADGSDARRLTTHLAADFNPAWSPDGKTIAFHSNRRTDSNELLGPYQLYVTGADGSGTPTKLSTTGGEDENPAWSPGGTALVFQSNANGDTDIWVMDSQRNQTDVTRAPREYDYVPDW
jgi:hypothetical protein